MVQEYQCNTIAEWTLPVEPNQFRDDDGEDNRKCTTASGHEAPPRAARPVSEHHLHGRGPDDDRGVAAVTLDDVRDTTDTSKSQALPPLRREQPTSPRRHRSTARARPCLPPARLASARSTWDDDMSRWRGTPSSPPRQSGNAEAQVRSTIARQRRRRRDRTNPRPARAIKRSQTGQQLLCSTGSRECSSGDASSGRPTRPPPL